VSDVRFTFFFFVGVSGGGALSAVGVSPDAGLSSLSVSDGVASGVEVVPPVESGVDGGTESEVGVESVEGGGVEGVVAGVEAEADDDEVVGGGLGGTSTSIVSVNSAESRTKIPLWLILNLTLMQGDSDPSVGVGIEGKTYLLIKREDSGMCGVSPYVTTMSNGFSLLKVISFAFADGKGLNLGYTSALFLSESICIVLGPRRFQVSLMG